MRLFQRKRNEEKKGDDARQPVISRIEIDANQPIPVSEFLIDKAEKENCSLYGIVDSARNEEVFRYLLADNVKYKSLFEGTKDVRSYGVSGFLVECKKESPLFNWLTTEAWGDSCCIFFTSKASFEELFKHFQKFNRVYLEDDDVVLFRYYDPRVLSIYLPTCTKSELDTFYGEVETFYLEDKDSGLVNGYNRKKEVTDEELVILNSRVMVK